MIKWLFGKLIEEHKMKKDGHKIDQVIDCRKLSCPLPVLKVKNAINQMEIGMILEMIATDPGSVKDIPAWVKQTGQELMETAHEDGHFMFLIKKLR